jgi:ParB-like chromosome segregation protein Spo0J
VAAIGTRSAEERRFLYTATPPSPGLVASVRAAGILEPLVISAAGSLISGVRRLEAARELAQEDVPVLRAADPVRAFLTGLWENLGHRAFTPLEKGEILTRLEGVAGLDRETVLRSFMPALGLPPAAAAFARHAALASLPPALKALAARGLLRDSHLFLLAGLPAEDGEALAHVFAALAPSAGEARDLKRLLVTLARRERTTIGSTVARRDVAAILEDGDRPPRLRVGRLRRLLRALTVPSLAAIEEEAASLATEAGLSGPVRLTLPPDLRRGDVEIAFRVGRGADLVEAAAVLGSPRARAAVRRILALLRGER